MYFFELYGRMRMSAMNLKQYYFNFFLFYSKNFYTFGNRKKDVMINHVLAGNLFNINKIDKS